MQLASAPEPWSDCGFAIDGGVAQIGQVVVRFEDGRGGIGGWSLRGIESTDLDGLPTESSSSSSQPKPAGPAHPNGALGIDHIVATTPQLGRTVEALEAAGLALRRVREPEEPGPPLRQAFFRLGEVILEVVEDQRGGEGSARFWGITFAVADLERAAEILGERLGEVRDAVQPGRRIATVRRDAGLGLPVALISAEKTGM